MMTEDTLASVIKSIRSNRAVPLFNAFISVRIFEVAFWALSQTRSLEICLIENGFIRAGGHTIRAIDITPDLKIAVFNACHVSSKSVHSFWAFGSAL